MSIVSFSFIIFMIVTIIVYFVIPRKYQWVVLLFANLMFYTMAGYRLIIFILFTITTVYFAALSIEYIYRESRCSIKITDISIEEKKLIKAAATLRRKNICFIAIVCNFGIWVALKYSPFLISNLNILLQFLGANYELSITTFALPIGISFYTFQAAGYLIDVYRKKYPAEENFCKFALFLSFFPHIIQGPFSRYDELGKTLFNSHTFSYTRLCIGLRRILWGYCKKLLIADNIAVVVNEIFGNYSEYSSMHMIAVAFFYAIQIYADFSGYMDIVCGFTNILGIELQENFKQPYFAKSIDEFWRRWHISLGRWFKDYLFYPIAISKRCKDISHIAREKFGQSVGKVIPIYIALFFVWTATGLWHGATWTYLIWGYINFVVIAISMQLNPLYSKIKARLRIRENSKGLILFQISRTFLLVCFFRFFSRGGEVHIALEMLRKLFSFDGFNNILIHPTCLFPGLTWTQILVFVFGTIALFIVDVLNECNQWEKIKAICPYIIRCLVYTILVFSIILFAGSNNIMGGFMYANF